MKTITYQTDKRHSSVIQKYGCLFKSIGYFSKKDISIEEQNSIWDMLVRNGAITGETRRNTRARRWKLKQKTQVCFHKYLQDFG